LKKTGGKKKRARTIVSIKDEKDFFSRIFLLIENKAATVQGLAVVYAFFLPSPPSCISIGVLVWTSV